MKISVLIPAYKTPYYLASALDSVAMQKYPDFEVLVGIDGCPKTREAAIAWMQSNRDDRFRFFDSRFNHGTYKMVNTLFRKADHPDYIMTFGSDDVMFPGLLMSASGQAVKNRIVQFWGVRELHKPSLVIGPCNGNTLIPAHIFEELRGYKAWICGADSDFYVRAHRKNIDFADCPITPAFFYRKNPESLTESPNTKVGSEIRNFYASQRGIEKTDQMEVIPDLREIVSDG